MSLVSIIRHFTTPLLVLIVTVTIAGCSKKEVKPVAVVPPVDPSAAAPATPVSAAPVASIPVSTDIQKSFAEADAALNAKAYEKAAQNLLAVQRQAQLTEQQAQEAQRRMIGLQQNLAAAIANGDPNAMAAAELLRRSSMVK